MKAKNENNRSEISKSKINIKRLFSIVTVLIVCLTVFTPLLSTTASAQSKQEIEIGAGPEVISPLIKTTKYSEVPSISETTAEEYDYVSHIFTVADVIFFSYKDGTEVALFDSSGTLIWNNNGNPLNKGEHARVTVIRGVYTACGSEKFALLTGDPITRYVVGYYAMDQNGYGASTELYTWVPQIYGHCSFIVFAYQDNTQVTVEYTDTGIDIAAFTLNKGEHWRIETLDREWLHVTANKPVSALACYDQGYFVPSASGKWSGTEFYTYVSDIASWPEDLTVMAYDDGTSLTIKDSDTGAVIWSGTLNSGEAHVESYPDGADKFFTITSSKPVTVNVQPWISMSCCYHQGAYVADSTGTMLGTDLIGSTLNDGYLYILAYRDNTNVVVYNSQTEDLIATYTLDEGDYVEANPGNGLWRIMSNYPVSAYSGWGYWNADFAPVEFREVTAVNVDILYTDKSCYASNEDITISAKVTDADGNPLHPLEKENFKVSMDGSEVDIEGFERVSCTDYKLKIKAPETFGTYSITVTANVATGKGSDSTEIKVYTIDNVYLSVEGNRLTQYENSADTPVYYRGDPNIYPIFYIDLEVNGATLSEIKDYIQVLVNINDYTKVRDAIGKKAIYDPVTLKYKAEWKNSPDNYPVGKYNVTAALASPLTHDKNTLLCDSDFDFANSLSEEEIQSIFNSRNSFFKEYIDPATGKLASWVIADRSQHYQISSKVLLAKMQQESSSVWTYRDMNKHISYKGKDMGTRADWVLFYGWTDKGPIEKYKGFYNQVDGAAKSLSEWWRNPSSEDWAAHQPHTVVDYVDDKKYEYIVTPTNNATCALYIYTPHVSSNKLLHEVWMMMFNYTCASEKKHFYLVFKPLAGYESFITSQISAEIHHAAPAPDPIPGAGFIGTKFNNLHQFEYRNWKNTLDEITSCISRRDAIDVLTPFSHGIDIGGTVDDSYYGYWHMDDDESLPFWDLTHLHGHFIYGGFGCSRDYASDGLWPGQNAWWWDVDRFKDSNFNPEGYTLPHNRPTGVCADYAPLLISHARSAGIAAREIGGFWAGGGGHAVTEVYYDNEWHHCDPTWNEMEEPWTYSDEGYFWTSYKTSSNSPWSVFPPWATSGNPGIKTDVINREDYYNYIAKTTNIDFDKTDYDYPDLVNLDITVENTGKMPIIMDYLHLLIFDKPTIARLGPAHLRCDIVLTENLIPGETETYSCQYQLPDYGLLNEFYELIGDRYVVAEVHYYNSTFQPYHSIAIVTKVEERVPGLCPEWNPQITADGLTVTLDTANSTSFFFSDITNESTETFVKPQNASVTVEHKIKYYTNYTRENWYIFNPNNNTHDYSLMTPLLGIGNAVYIPGYGSITANQTVDTSADYIVIYNTTHGTNGSVDIYTFSKNVTLKDITLFNGVVKVVGMQNCTLASESGESFLSYFSTRNGSGTSFDEIYNNFSQEIVSNGDTLTQFFIEGEHEQISYYKVGDILYVNTTVFNNGMLAETRSLSLTITEPGVWGSENVIYNTTETVIIPAKSEADVMFQYQIPYNPQIGKHRIIVSDDITKATTIFMIQAPFNVTFDVPTTVAQAEEFYANATITNALGISLSVINVTIELPNDFYTSEDLTKNIIGTLFIGESANVSWLVNATDFEYGYAPITIHINSTEGINDIATASLTVLRLPELKIFPSAPPEAQINVSFDFKANVTNEGDLNLSGVSINLSLPDNVTTTDNLIKLIGNLSGGETKSVNWTITSMRENDFWIEVDGCDVNGAYCARATELINIVRPEIELDLVNPVEVILNQSFSAIAKIKNIGELNATQVKVNLSLPQEFETVKDTFVNIGDLLPEQTKEVEWTLKGVNPGYGEITVNVTSSSDISITRGIIVTHFPLLVKTDKGTYMEGENVIITTTTTNSNPEISYVDLLVNITVEGDGIEETYSMPIDYISSLETRNFALTWNTTGKPAGDYTVTAKILEGLIVLNENGTSFTFETVNKPPVADAGPDQTVERSSSAGAEVTLNGSGSYDPDVDPITYKWTWDAESTIGVSPTVVLPMGMTMVTLTVSDGVLSDTDTVEITVEDTTPPVVLIEVPAPDVALQDGVILTADASDLSGVTVVYFYVREPGGVNGTPIGYEDLPASLTAGKWKYTFDTTLVPDGYYVILAKAVDTYGNEGWSDVVPFSIRNWAVVELLPASERNKAGRTMPVKFSLRIAESVDPEQPFVYNEELEIRIYNVADHTTILQNSQYGDTSRDYRIDNDGELYITNFKTKKKQPAEYVVEIWRPNANDFLVGSFTFETTK